MNKEEISNYLLSYLKSGIWSSHDNRNILLKVHSSSVCLLDDQLLFVLIGQYDVNVAGTAQRKQKRSLCSQIY